VEWLNFTDPHGISRKRRFLLPRSLANFKRYFSDGGQGLVEKTLARTGNRKYRPSAKQKPDLTVAHANKRLASRFYQLKTGYRLTGQYLHWTTRRSCWWCQYKIQTCEHLFKDCPQWRS